MRNNTSTLFPFFPSFIDPEQEKKSYTAIDFYFYKKYMFGTG